MSECECNWQQLSVAKAEVPKQTTRNPLNRCPVTLGKKGILFGLVEFKGEPFPPKNKEKGTAEQLGQPEVLWMPPEGVRFATSIDQETHGAGKAREHEVGTVSGQEAQPWIKIPVIPR